MKLKTKITIAATSLLVLSGVAASASTFAWFTANNRAYAQFDGKVTTNMEDLKVEVLNTDKFATFSAGSTGDTVYTKALTRTTKLSNITDVSCSGTDFVVPTLQGTTGNFTDTNKVSNPTIIADTAATVYYDEFALKFTTDRTDVNTGVFLSKNTEFKFTETTVTGSKLTEAMRVAVYTASTIYYNADFSEYKTATATGFTNAALSAGTLLALYAPSRTMGVVDGKEQAKYLPFGAAAGELADQYTAFVPASIGNVKYYGSDNYTADMSDKDFVDQATAPTSYKGFLGVADATGLSVIVRIWCEGSDSVCDNANLEVTDANNISATVKFNGVNLGTHADLAA